MCTLLTQCASPRIGCWHSRGYAYTASRAWAVKRDHAPSQDSAGASLLDRQTWWSRVTNVGPVRHRAIDSSELRLTTDREGRRVGHHRSHIVAAVSSACLIARAAASGSQGRIVSSLSPGRPRACRFESRWSCPRGATRIARVCACDKTRRDEKQKRTSMFLLPRPRRDLPFVLAPMQRRLE